MARTDSLTNYLTDVAEAIKAKKGDDTPINASTFDSEIINLPGRSPTAIDIKGVVNNFVVGDAAINEGEFVKYAGYTAQSHAAFNKNGAGHSATFYIGNHTFITINYNEIHAWTIDSNGTYNQIDWRYISPDTTMNAIFEAQFPEVTTYDRFGWAATDNKNIAFKCFNGVVLARTMTFRMNSTFYYVRGYQYWTIENNKIVSKSGCFEPVYGTSSTTIQAAAASVVQLSANTAMAIPETNTPGIWATVLELTDDGQLVISKELSQINTIRYATGFANGVWDGNYAIRNALVYNPSTTSTSSTAASIDLNVVGLDDNDNLVSKQIIHLYSSMSPGTGNMYVSNTEGNKVAVLINARNYYVLMLILEIDPVTGLFTELQRKELTVTDASGICLIEDIVYIFRLSGGSADATRILVGYYDILQDTYVTPVACNTASLHERVGNCDLPSNVGQLSPTRVGDNLIAMGVPIYDSSTTSAVNKYSGGMPVTIKGVIYKLVTQSTTADCVGVATQTKQPGYPIKVIQGPSSLASGEAV